MRKTATGWANSMNGDYDTFLLQRWHAERDAHAFREIATRHSQMVFATCKRIRRNASDAEDVTQECFLTLAQHAGNPPQSLAAWLYTVAVHQSLNRLRALGRQTKREQKFTEGAHPAAAPSFDANFQKHRRITGEYPVTIAGSEQAPIEISL